MCEEEEGKSVESLKRPEDQFRSRLTTSTQVFPQSSEIPLFSVHEYTSSQQALITLN